MVSNCQDRNLENFIAPDCGSIKINFEVFDGSKRINRPTNFVVFEERESKEMENYANKSLVKRQNEKISVN